MDEPHGAKVPPVPPPIYFLVAFICGVAFDWEWTWVIGGRPAVLIVGLALLVAAVLLAGSAIGLFVRSNTTVIPHHRVSALVARGPYRFSRNPMYVAFVLAYIGLAFMLDMWWPIVLVPLPLVAVRYFVIAREERYLEELFGAKYREYCQNVRRWL